MPKRGVWKSEKYLAFFWESFSPSIDHLILLDNHGRIYSCGCGEQGQLGRISPRSADRHSRHGVEPLLMPAMVKFKVGQKFEFDDIWAGTYCTFARSYPSGEIYAFGLNNYRQTGELFFRQSHKCRKEKERNQ